MIQHLLKPQLILLPIVPDTVHVLKNALFSLKATRRIITHQDLPKVTDRVCDRIGSGVHISSVPALCLKQAATFSPAFEAY